VGQTNRHPRHAAEDEEIEVVERRSPEPYTDLTGAGLGFRPITVAQLVGSTVLFEVQGFHKYLLRPVL